MRPTLRINLTVIAQDPDDQDDHHRTGLTARAYERLLAAISQAGFELYAGPAVAGWPK